MESFANDLNVINKDNLRNIWKHKTLSRLRKHIYDFMISRTRENDFFDIDTFNRKYVKDIDITSNLVNTVVEELNSLGWNTYIGFGGTGLYIYSSNDSPSGMY